MLFQIARIDNRAHSISLKSLLTSFFDRRTAYLAQLRVTTGYDGPFNTVPTLFAAHCGLLDLDRVKALIIGEIQGLYAALEDSDGVWPLDRISALGCDGPCMGDEIKASRSVGPRICERSAWLSEN